MNILCLQPEQRLSQTEFDQVGDSKNGHKTFLVYTCPLCGRETTFTPSGFLEQPAATPGTFYRTLFDQKFQRENGTKTRDFHCPGCNQPVRIEYTTCSTSADGRSVDSRSVESRSIEDKRPIDSRLDSRLDNRLDNRLTSACSIRMLRVLEIVLPPFPSPEELLAGLNRVEDLFYSLSLNQPPSVFPYLWLAALILFPLPYDSPHAMARTFYHEKQKLDSILGWSFVWEWIDKDPLAKNQILIWLAALLRFEAGGGNREGSVETAAARMLKMSDLLRGEGLEEKPETLSMTLALALAARTDEDARNCTERIAELKNSLRENYTSSWKSMLTLISADGLRPVLADGAGLDRLRQINQDLARRNFLLSEKDRGMASLLLYLQDKNPQACVNRFIRLGSEFNLAVSRREKALVNPLFFPDENHPFHQVVLSLLTEFSPAFPFDSSCFSPVALLCGLSWKAEDLARESIGLYHYLRSYRKFINPDISFWVATGLIFSIWEDSPDIFLFWIMGSLAAMSDLQLRQQSARKISFPQA